MFIVLAIGKTFLILLFVFVCIVAAILFFPVSYELDLDLEERRASVRINWLLRLVRFRFHVKERMEAVLSVLCFRLDFTDPEAKKRRAGRRAAKQRRQFEKQEKKRKRRQKKKKRKETAADRANTPRDREETLVSVSGEPHSQQNTEEVSGEEAAKKSPEENGSRDSGSENGASAEKLSDKAGRMFGYLGTFRRIFGLVRKYEVLSTVWPKLVRFLKRVRPRVVRGRIAFGLEDPAATGQLTGLIAVIPLFYETELCISPDFETEETYVRGNIYIKGHLLLIHVLVLLIGLIREKKLRSFVGAARKRA